MSALVAAVLVWIAGAVASFVVPRGRAAITGAFAAVAGGLLGTFAAVAGLAGAPAGVLRFGWAMPPGEFALRLDPLAAAFLLPVCAIGAIAAPYGVAYLRPHADHHPPGPRFAAYNLLLASMALVVTATNLLLFLFCWEVMTLSSCALVMSDHETRAARDAGLLYLVAGHVATGALFVLFARLAGAGAWDVTVLEPLRAPETLLFLLALVGFGTKAGIVPFHVWLPDAHSAAPGHVSALMSGVMITMGFYGLARFLPLLGPPTVGSAALLLVLGGAGAFAAVALSLTQGDAKRALAYSTVENAGLVTLALGVARLAEALHQPALAGLAWAAALLHLWSHSLFKSLLFLATGEAAQATGTRDLESWGGLLARAKDAGASLMAGAAAASGLPPFVGFVSEWLILATLFSGAVTLRGPARAAMVLGLAVTAATLALAAFGAARLAGIGWLGTPRSDAASRAPAPAPAMRVSMGLLAVIALAAGVVPVVLARGLARPLAALVPAADPARVATLVAPLGGVALAVLVAVALVALVRRFATRGAERRAATWGCGYERPTARMQYTASSLSAPLTGSLRPLLRPQVRVTGFAGRWPSAARWESRTLDRTRSDLYRPAVERTTSLFARLRGLQEPHVTTHLRYLLLALLVVLALLFLPVGGPR